MNLTVLLNKIKGDDEIGFHGSRATLARLLHDIGFEFKREDKRKALMEKPEISFKRFQFLKSYLEYKQLGYDIVFLDETWFYSKGM